MRADLIHAFRVLRNAPAFACAAILVIALGIGANTAIFSAVNAILLRPLPYKDPSQLVLVWERSPRGQKDNVVNPMNYVAWRDQNTSFSDMAAVLGGSAALTGSGEPEEIKGIYVTDKFLSILEVKPALGRDFRPEDMKPGAPQTVLLSDGFWRSRFGGDASILNRTLMLDGQKAEVIGILPAGFRYQFYSGNIVMPFQIDPVRHFRGRYISTVARLKPGITVERAQSEMDSIAARLAAQYPEKNSKWGAYVVGLQEYIANDVKPVLLVLLGAVALILLIACANVANLLLIRATGRRREFAVRAAIGAGAGRLVRQLITESLVLCTLGGFLGTVLGIWSIQALMAALPPRLFTAQMTDIHLDGRVILFTTALTFLTGVLFGLAPAFSAVRLDLHQVLKAGTRTTGDRRNLLRNSLVVAEVAVAFVLLVGAGLMLRSFARLLSAPLGLQPDHVLTMRLDAPTNRRATPESITRYWEEILSRVEALPRIKAAGISHTMPLTPMISATGFWLADQPKPRHGEEPVTDVLIISPGYFHALGASLAKGRDFTSADRDGSPLVLIINEAMARQFYAGQNPVGRKLFVQWGRDVPYEIIGVAADVRTREPALKAKPTVFFTYRQERMGGPSLIVRTEGDPIQMASLIRAQIHQIEPDQTIDDVRTLGDVISAGVARPRVESILLAAFAALALVLAVVGIYGVISYSVGQRTSEIGIRMALGASAQNVLSGILGESIRLAVLGLAIGLVIAVFAAGSLEKLLYEVQPRDPATFTVVALVLFMASVGAAFLPARRATRIDPSTALRQE